MFSRNPDVKTLLKCMNIGADDRKNGFQHMNNFLPSCVCAMLQKKTNAPTSPNLLENILDISSTITQILTICGLENQKANKAMASITHAFMHFDEKYKNPGTNVTCKSRHLRKEDLYDALRKDCCMSEEEAKLASALVKCAFRAFYHKQSLRKYDVGYFAEDDWQGAAQRTINAYAKTGATKSELEIAEQRIHNAYKGYINRVATKSPTSDPDRQRSLKGGCMCCSPKSNYNPYIRIEPNPMTGTPYKQVTCSCCGCLKQGPAAYRDSKGRSILFMENNDLYYNSEPMRQEVNNIRTSFAEGTKSSDRKNDAFCEFNADDNSLPRALYKLAHDIVEKAIKGRPSGPKCEDDQQKKILQKRSSLAMSRGNKAVEPKKCGCVSQFNRHSQSQRNEDERLSDLSGNKQHEHGDGRPVSSKVISINEADLEEVQHRHLIADDQVLQIELRGLCRKIENGRANIDLLGLKLINNRCETTEFVCKRRVHLMNSYTQTGGSAGPSRRSSKISARAEKRTSGSSVKSKTSKGSAKRQPDPLSIDHDHHGHSGETPRERPHGQHGHLLEHEPHEFEKFDHDRKESDTQKDQPRSQETRPQLASDVSEMNKPRSSRLSNKLNVHHSSNLEQIIGHSEESIHILHQNENRDESKTPSKLSLDMERNEQVPNAEVPGESPPGVAPVNHQAPPTTTKPQEIQVTEEPEAEKVSLPQKVASIHPDEAEDPQKQPTVEEEPGQN